jgi:hypothetical protein
VAIVVYSLNVFGVTLNPMGEVPNGRLIMGNTNTPPVRGFGEIGQPSAMGDMSGPPVGDLGNPGALGQMDNPG